MKGNMKTLHLIFLMMISSVPFTYAGIGACHDGNGNITALELDANPAAFTGQNCAYYKDADYERVFAKIGHLKGKERYVKWSGGEPDAMAPAEQVAVDDAWAAEIQAAKDASDARLEVSMEEAVTALVQVINVRLPAGQKITKAEIVAQIKANR